MVLTHLRNQVKGVTMDQTEEKKRGDGHVTIGRPSSASGLKCLTSISDQLHRTPPSSTKFLWALMCPLKIQLFLWKAFEGLQAVDNLTHIHLTDFDNYHLCNTRSETTYYTLLHYHVTDDSWHADSSVTNIYLDIISQYNSFLLV